MQLKSYINKKFAADEKKSKKLFREAIQLADDSANALQQMEYKELLLALGKAYRLLPEACRLVCWLHYGKGFSKKEISLLLHVSLSTVNARLNYGLHLLKRELIKRKNPF